MILSAENISHHYNKHHVLDRVSLTLNKGDFTTIIGPNGAGKSTLLKCLMGLIKPKQGRVSRNLNSQIGYIPQRIQVNPSLPMCVERFIKLNTKNGVETDLEYLDIIRLKDKPIHSLSGGEWQKVLLARALRDRPDAIILDEPAQNLDIPSQVQFHKILNQIHTERGIAILMVSHDLHMVMASQQNVICLNNHICCSGPAQQIARDPAFAQLFGHDMASMTALYQQQSQPGHIGH